MKNIRRNDNFRNSRKTVYMNMETGEITFDHMTAVRNFFNNGANVLVYLESNPTINITWEH